MNEWPSIFPNVSFQKEHVLERKPAVLFPTFPTSKYVLHTKKNTPSLRMKAKKWRAGISIPSFLECRRKRSVRPTLQIGEFLEVNLCVSFVVGSLGMMIQWLLLVVVGGVCVCCCCVPFWGSCQCVLGQSDLWSARVLRRPVNPCSCATKSHFFVHTLVWLF